MGRYPLTLKSVESSDTIENETSVVSVSPDLAKAIQNYQ